ncbi:MAG TPA: vanadium-dependent haloperoxidase [Candidatus Binatia bacterium]|nr:vanadium-dependent haloperoxidase [Candidatus Binatia bacterium]
MLSFLRQAALVAVVSVLVLPGQAVAQRQSPAHQACQNALHKSGSKLAGVVGKQMVACIADAGSGDFPGGQTVADCLTSDPRGKIGIAETKVQETESSRCTATPPFGASEADLVIDGYEAVFPVQDVFGPDVDAAILDAGTDPDGAACQAAIAKAMAQIMKVRLKEFQRCVSKGLLSAQFLNGIAQSTCFDNDSQGKIAKAVAKAQGSIVSACNGTAVADAAPGDCASVPLAGLAACIDERLSCAQCEGMGTADAVEGLCDLYDDSLVNGSCFFPSPPQESVAHVWDETLLEAIRRDTPRPTVHARNLFHLSAAMYDAWVAYNGSGDAYITSESPTIVDPEAELHEALSYAAYRLLRHRFASSVAAFTARTLFDYRMAVYGYDVLATGTAGDAPSAVGNRIGQAAITYGSGDGSNEGASYNDTTGYAPVNEPLIVQQAGTDMEDPNRWQPLTLSVILAQNGTPISSNTQSFLGPHWGNVFPFALTRALPTDVYQDPGPPPYLSGAGDAEFRQAVLEVIRYSSYIDGDDPTTMDVSPGARGNNPLGTDDGSGHVLNPATAMPYEPNLVRRADFARATAEFWADGPASETPPGHWNTIANEVSSHPDFERRFEGAGPIVDELEWDVKMYLALNGSLHDAAIAAWNAKRAYDSSRPISQIRYMGGKGQSSDPMGENYDPEGLPLEPGLVELITPLTTAPGERHAHLAGNEGQVAILAWGGNPVNPETQFGDAIWVRAIEWLPYQLSTFVSPAFPGYVSGHSTFSRAAAEVMTSLTGSEFFPGGIHEVEIAAGGFAFEAGPVAPLTLQWATYYDAADDAGLSRRLAGIHVWPDDYSGRQMGAAIGDDAWILAKQYFDGTAVP